MTEKLVLLFCFFFCLSKMKTWFWSSDISQKMDYSKLGVVNFVKLESLLDFGTNAKQFCQSAVVLMKCN